MCDPFHSCICVPPIIPSLCSVLKRPVNKYCSVSKRQQRCRWLREVQARRWLCPIVLHCTTHLLYLGTSVPHLPCLLSNRSVLMVHNIIHASLHIRFPFLRLIFSRRPSASTSTTAKVSRRDFAPFLPSFCRLVLGTSQRTQWAASEFRYELSFDYVRVYILSRRGGSFHY